MNFIHHPDPIKFLLEAGNDQIENIPEFWYLSLDAEAQ
jgi:hypothetical protein